MKLTSLSDLPVMAEFPPKKGKLSPDELDDKGAAPIPPEDEKPNEDDDLNNAIGGWVRTGIEDMEMFQCGDGCMALVYSVKPDGEPDGAPMMFKAVTGVDGQPSATTDHESLQEAKQVAQKRIEEQLAATTQAGNNPDFIGDEPEEGNVSPTGKGGEDDSEDDAQGNHDEPDGDEEECQACTGTGTGDDQKPCKSCGGSGLVEPQDKPQGKSPVKTSEEILDSLAVKAGAPIGNKNAAGPHAHSRFYDVINKARFHSIKPDDWKGEDRASQFLTHLKKVAETTDHHFAGFGAIRLGLMAQHPHEHEAAAVAHEHAAELTREADKLQEGLEPHRRVDFSSVIKHHEESAKLHRSRIGDLAANLESADSILDNLAVKASGHDLLAGLTVKARASNHVVHCTDMGITLASQKWETDKPVCIQWMPAGVTTINAHWNNKPVELTVQCDEYSAKVVQASFDDWCKKYPKQRPFGCVEHREEEAAILPTKFEWRTQPEPGVFCHATATELGARNVNGRMHRSWSPSFLVDAAWSKIVEQDGVVTFPEGVRGSRSNPARITGVAFSVGSLTNKPAFKNILPVRAKESAVKAGAPRGNKNAEGPHTGHPGKAYGMTHEQYKAHWDSRKANGESNAQGHQWTGEVEHEGDQTWFHYQDHKGQTYSSKEEPAHRIDMRAVPGVRIRHMHGWTNANSSEKTTEAILAKLASVEPSADDILNRLSRE